MKSKRDDETSEAGVAVRARDKRGSARRLADREDQEAMEHADSMLEESFAEIAATHERMAVTQMEIERLKAENHELLAQSRRILEEIKTAA